MYNRISPINTITRIENIVCVLTSTMVNIARAIHTKKGEKPKLTEPSDFIPTYDKAVSKPKKSPDDIKSKFLSILKHKRSDK